MAVNSGVKKILPYAILLSVGITVFTFVAKSSNLIKFGKTASWTVKKIKAIDIKGGIPNGYLASKIDISIDNPTDTMVRVKKPYIRAFIDGKAVGNSIPSPEITDVQPNSRTIIPDVELQMPVMKVIPLIPGIVQKILKGEKMGKSVELDISINIEGNDFTKKVNFDI